MVNWAPFSVWRVSISEVRPRWRRHKLRLFMSRVYGHAKDGMHKPTGNGESTWHAAPWHGTATSLAATPTRVAAVGAPAARELKTPRPAVAVTLAATAVA